MQLILLAITVILSIVLYRMLSNQTATYPFIRTTKLSRTEDDAEYQTTEAEHGLITIDHDMVIVEGQEYTLKSSKDKQAEAYLTIDNGKLISISIRLNEGEKQFFIDPEHSLYTSNQYHSRVSDHSHHHIFSF